MKAPQAIARTDENGKPCQTVQEHLEQVAQFTKKFSTKLNMCNVGELLGWLHDMGKYGEQFQNYITQEKQEAHGPDHSTAGAQIAWQYYEDKGALERCLGQILGLCIASHHGGLIDCLSPNGEANFLRRMEKPAQKTSVQEARGGVAPVWTGHLGLPRR